MKIAVTGSTGPLGNWIIEKLQEMGVQPVNIVALARDMKKAQPLADKGILCRQGDYTQPDSLLKAFEGVDKLMMVSSSEIGQRAAQHKNVIEAAKKAGVKMVVYTSLFHADTSVSPLAEEHRITEKEILESGIPFVILRNNWYSENQTEDVQRAGKFGFIESAAGGGKIQSAPRKDYAEAAAKVLTTEGHVGRVYELSGAPWNFEELAQTASDIWGKRIKYKPVNPRKRKRHLKMFGLPAPVAEFVTSLDVSIKEGALEGEGSDLEQLLGRKPEGIKETYSSLVSKA